MSPIRTGRQILILLLLVLAIMAATTMFLLWAASGLIEHDPEFAIRILGFVTVGLTFLVSTASIIVIVTTLRYFR